jgi:beta-mannosidase
VIPETVVLDGQEWLMAPFYGEDWRRVRAFVHDTKAPGWLPVQVPGSIHWELLRHGEIPDPYWEVNSRLSEWVHQRSWVFKRDLSVPESWSGSRVLLEFEGVDYDAEYFWDGERIGASDSMFLPARFDVTHLVRPGEKHHLAVAVREAPCEQPQIGRTSQVKTTKARFGYWWDFAARLVNTGIWQSVRLRSTGPALVGDVWVRPLLSPDFETATLVVTTSLDLASATDVSVDVVVSRPDGSVVAAGEAGRRAGRGSATLPVTLEVRSPQLWWPNGHGGQPLYRCRVVVRANGDASDEREVSFGIREITLRPNPWPPEGAPEGLEPPLPYTFTVNGKPILVKGWNVVPVDLMFSRADLGERYAQLVALAKASGANLLRVNGVGLIEREVFYDLCDRAGLMVWQEFTQSSSGIDNVPPAMPEMLERFRSESSGIIPLRRNHPSLAVWCGGNELTDQRRVPTSSAKSPALALLESQVRSLDPDRPYIPTSPSGPVYDLEDYVALERPGELHDVHGGWHYRGPVDTYIGLNNSTALFHSEFGTQGAVAYSSLRRFMSPERMWPPDATNPLWVHHGAWWMMAHRVREVFGEVEDIREYLQLSQFIQAEGLRYGIESNRRRWPSLSGLMPWQLNEPWPNGHNTCVVDYYLRPKPAYYWAKRAYQPATASLRYETPLLREGRLSARVFAVTEERFLGQVTATVRKLDGEVLLHEVYQVDAAGVQELGTIELDGLDEVVICRLELHDESGQSFQVNDYFFGPEREPLAAMRQVGEARLEISREGDDLLIENRAEAPALFPTVDIDDPRWHWRVSDNGPLLLPGERARLALKLEERLERADPDHPRGRVTSGPLVLRVSGWNTTEQSLDWEV